MGNYMSGYVDGLEKVNAMAKEDVVALLKELKDELFKTYASYCGSGNEVTQAYADGIKYANTVIQSKIDSLE